MLILIFKTIYLALPAMAGNSLPVIAAGRGWLPWLNRPLDNNEEVDGKRILGDHKTVRGLLVGALGGVAIGLIQYLLHYYGVFAVPELGVWWKFLLFGLLAGVGALAGDAAASFIKRRVGIKSGQPFVPVDQIDYVIGFLLFTWPLYPWGVAEWAILLILAGILNPLTNIAAYKLGLKDTYW